LKDLILVNSKKVDENILVKNKHTFLVWQLALALLSDASIPVGRRDRGNYQHHVLPPVAHSCPASAQAGKCSCPSPFLSLSCLHNGYHATYRACLSLSPFYVSLMCYLRAAFFVKLVLILSHLAQKPLVF
jgi:hypothetical protein